MTNDLDPGNCNNPVNIGNPMCAPVKNVDPAKSISFVYPPRCRPPIEILNPIGAGLLDTLKCRAGADSAPTNESFS